MLDLIDWRIIERENTPYLVRIYEDHDSSPQDSECYSDRDIAAWVRGDWRYVTVSVAEEASKSVSVSAVEWGILPELDVPAGWNYVEDHLLSDMISELKGL